MEFCGGHTFAILQNGIRDLLPSNLELVSGPGCPVCVTAISDLDKAIFLSHLPQTIITTFGDMVRVPGSHGSLASARAEGADVRIVYSTMDALDIAQENPQSQVIFVGIGFETTAPTIAASIVEAQRREIDNYHVLPLGKLCPPVMRALLKMGETKIDGIIGPGHVSTIIGSKPYEFIPREYGVPFVISGFEPLDILLTVEMLVEQIEEEDPKVEIAYRRGVKPEGNAKAQQLMEEVFEVSDANWRGIGDIPRSGLSIREKFSHFDALKAYNIEPGPPREPKGCICGEILRGIKNPKDCRLFRLVCTPENPVGPCMVSSEGSCAAYYRYGGEDG
jgi:hydrogenase expression/formation protein HypD